MKRFGFNYTVLLCVFIILGVLNGCGGSGGGGSSGSASLKIYEMTAENGTFYASAADGTRTVFRISLRGLSELLFFTNRGSLEAGYDGVDDLVNRVWPLVYNTTGPNAAVQYTAGGNVYNLFCILNDPVFDSITGRLDFTITYLEGQRPVDGLAISDVKMIITNNAEQVQPPEWSTILGGEAGFLQPTNTDGVYTLTIDGVYERLFDFTSAPHRNTLLITPEELIQVWTTRFGSVPPNASLSYSPPANAKGGVQVLVLTNPVYDQGSNSITFTAQSLFGTDSIGTGMTVYYPTLFIDSGDGDKYPTHDNAFPTYDGNHFSIQYRNSTSKSITVWLMGSQPPCSEAEAANCDAGNDPDKYSDEWANMKDAFTRSGTHFYVHNNSTGAVREIDVSNHIDLEPGETLRITPPLDANNKPQWYYSVGGVVQTAGVNGWVVQKGIDMPAPQPVNLFEYNLDYPHFEIYADISGVDGINVNASMALEGAGCGEDPTCGTGVTMPRKVMTNIDPYDGRNDGCPYVMTFQQADVCPNPKHYPATINDSSLPNWVVGTDSFTTDDVASDYTDIWTGAGSPTGFEMCSAASGLPAPKKAYHIWWSTNNVGQSWLDYLQKNDKGRCDAYGWAYDEKRWKPGDDFDVNGNPPDNTSINPLFKGPMQDDTYLNIDILKIM